MSRLSGRSRLDGLLVGVAAAVCSADEAVAAGTGLLNRTGDVADGILGQAGGLRGSGSHGSGSVDEVRRLAAAVGDANQTLAAALGRLRSTRDVAGAVLSEAGGLRGSGSGRSMDEVRGLAAAVGDANEALAAGTGGLRSARLVADAVFSEASVAGIDSSTDCSAREGRDGSESSGELHVGDCKWYL